MYTTARSEGEILLAEGIVMARLLSEADKLRVVRYIVLSEIYRARNGVPLTEEELLLERSSILTQIPEAAQPVSRFTNQVIKILKSGSDGASALCYGL